MVENFLKLGGGFLCLVATKIDQSADVDREESPGGSHLIANCWLESLDSCCGIPTAGLQKRFNRWSKYTVHLEVRGIAALEIINKVACSAGIARKG